VRNGCVKLSINTGSASGEQETTHLGRRQWNVHHKIRSNSRYDPVMGKFRVVVAARQRDTNETISVFGG
jgi:hypothetical protein